MITGGRGKIGSYVVRELMAQHHQVTIFSRGPQAPEGAGAIEGDVLNVTQLKAVCRGKDAACTCSRLENRMLRERFFPDVSLQRENSGHTTLVWHHRAAQDLG